MNSEAAILKLWHVATNMLKYKGPSFLEAGQLNSSQREIQIQDFLAAWNFLYSIISSDEDRKLRIERLVVIHLRGVSTKLHW